MIPWLAPEDESDADMYKKCTINKGRALVNVRSKNVWRVNPVA
jgi:hypothetical protein